MRRPLEPAIAAESDQGSVREDGTQTIASFEVVRPAGPTSFVIATLWDTGFGTTPDAR
jgi:hypothetical protein